MTAPCLLTLRELKTAIDARMLGRQVQSVGHKGRTMAYADTSLSDMIAYYNQLWRQCPDAQAEMPELKPLDQPSYARGPAMKVRFGDWT